MTTAIAMAETPRPVFVWAERDQRARLVIDDDLRVGWINGAASRMLKEASLFYWNGDRLALRDRSCMAAFRGFIRASGTRASTLCIPDATDDHVLCTALDVGSGGRGHVTGLKLRRATSPVVLDGAALESAFHLTRAERRVVERLFSGSTAEEAGASLRVSVGTVRVHIRHIYEKVAVSSREAMFHKLLPYMST